MFFREKLTQGKHWGNRHNVIMKTVYRYGLIAGVTFAGFAITSCSVDAPRPSKSPGSPDNNEEQTPSVSGDTSRSSSDSLASDNRADSNETSKETPSSETGKSDREPVKEDSTTESQSPTDSAIEERDEFNSDVYRATYYWTIHPEDADLSTERVDVIHEDGSLIARAPLDLVKKIVLEGSGFLEDGRLINIVCNCAYPSSRFVIVDVDLHPYGLDARGRGLVPFKSLAVDRRQIPLGTSIYIDRFYGEIMPDGQQHDGCFVAADVGGAIGGNRIDIFSGRRSDYIRVLRQLGTSNFELSLGDARCRP